MAANRQFCTFYLDKLLFGIDLHDVQEVMRYLDTTPIPLAPAIVEGLMNLRGQIVTAVDLRRKLDLAERSADARPMCVVVRSEEGAVSLLVDEIGDVVEVDESAFEPPPETVESSMRSTILGVYKMKDRLLHVLDTVKACEITTTEILTAEVPAPA